MTEPMTDLRAEARDKLKGNVGTAMWGTALFSVVSLITLGGLIFFFVVLFLPIRNGYRTSYLQLVRGGGSKELNGNMFQTIAMPGFWREVGVAAREWALPLLWGLLLVVPGIVKRYSLAMMPYIAHDNPILTAKECARRSEAMMQGHKAELLRLDLEFTPWWLLCIATCGLALIWVNPYYQCCRSLLYEELKK